MMLHWIWACLVMAGVGVVCATLLHKVGVLGQPHGDGKRRPFQEFVAVVLFTSMILWGMASIGILFGRVYVVDRPGVVEIYYALGKPDYSMSDSSSLSLDTHCIVNDTDSELILESVVYGNGEFEHDIIIPPFSVATIDSPGVIHYQFDQRPPKTIEAGTTGRAIQWWLRLSNAN